MHREHQIINQKKIFLEIMVYERTGVIAIIIGISVIISLASLISLPAYKSDSKDLWSFDTMRNELLNAEDKARTIIDAEKIEIKSKLIDMINP